VPRRLKDEITNLPNLITLFRIAVIPLVLYFIDNASPTRSFIATLIYTAAAASDFFDGYLARQRGETSMLGRYLDPLADKIMVMATLVWMVERERVPAWLVVVLLARELAITGLRAIASTEGIEVRVSDDAKMKTALQLVGILGLIIHFEYPILFTQITVDFHKVGMATLYMSLLFSVYSAVQYVRMFAEAVAQQDSRGIAE
jgi:CDP-diacylglycerol---glycerol-3-phosphate 3-phosphatidyltransferase